MLEQKEDRRIRRTKKLLKQGLMDLMVDKDFENISAKDVTECADLNRGTFYLHYQNTRALLEDIENDLIADFTSMVDAYHPAFQTHSHFQIIDQIFRYVCSHDEIFRCLLTDDSFLQKLIQVIMEKGFALHKAFCMKVSLETMEFTHYFIAYGVVGVLKNWFEEGRKASKESMITLLDGLVSPLYDKLMDPEAGL